MVALWYPTTGAALTNSAGVNPEAPRKAFLYLCAFTLNTHNARRTPSLHSYGQQTAPMPNSDPAYPSNATTILWRPPASIGWQTGRLGISVHNLSITCMWVSEKTSSRQSNE